jgi:polyhydroxyalkanoate synthesis regulator phasin
MISIAKRDRLEIGKTVRLKAKQPMRDILIEPGKGPKMTQEQAQAVVDELCEHKAGN